MQWPPESDWPNAALSRQVHVAPHRWHIQETGSGPTILMIHGAGGSTHSFGRIIPILRSRFHVVAIDLPGQGYTQLGARHRCGLFTMSQDIEKLCQKMDWRPLAIIGHSAGGAIALQLSRTMLSPRGQAPCVIGINPALDMFEGIAGVLFPALAKMLAAIPFSARLFSSVSATPRRIEALIGGTGSSLTSKDLEFYRRLVADRDHVDATLLMMAQWNLDDLNKDLPDLCARTLFITGGLDGAVPPKVSRAAANRMPDAIVREIADKGHLVHEEAPELVADHILAFLDA